MLENGNKTETLRFLQNDLEVSLMKLDHFLEILIFNNTRKKICF